MIDKRQLLCTFSNTGEYKNTIENIISLYTVYNKCFFLFSNDKEKNEIFITYNVVSGVGSFPKFPNTISIHRKKQTNTLYTLNAMNQIIRDENDGVFDKTFQVNWELYKDSLIITNDDFIRVISIKIHDIITLK